jgi:hypothetical protein
MDASNFLGLAEAKLEEGDAATAVALLRRMTLTTGEPFETLTPAAALLERFNRNTEAAEFLQQRVKAVPWDLEAALHLARATNAYPVLREIAASPNARYEVRVQAANALASQNGTASAQPSWTLLPLRRRLLPLPPRSRTSIMRV